MASTTTTAVAGAQTSMAPASLSRARATISMATTSSDVAGATTSMAPASLSRADGGNGDAEKLDYDSTALPISGNTGRASLLHRACCERYLPVAHLRGLWHLDTHRPDYDLHR